MPSLSKPEPSALFGAVAAMQNVSGEGHDTRFDWTTGVNASVARNNYAAKVLEDKSLTHLMFVDDDTVIEPDAISKLLALDADIATGVTPWVYAGRFLTNVAKAEGEDGVDWEPPWPEGIFECHAAGTSCMLIKRHVFEKIEFPWFNYYQKPGVGSFTTEDTPFSYRARKSGLKIMCDASVRCGHIKTMDLRQIFENIKWPQETIGVTAP